MCVFEWLCIVVYCCVCLCLFVFACECVQMLAYVEYLCGRLSLCMCVFACACQCMVAYDVCMFVYDCVWMRLVVCARA